VTERKRRGIKDKLIELGFWGADEPGDPTATYQDALTIHDRVATRIAKDHLRVSTWVGTNSLSRQAQVVCGEIVYNLAAADNYPESICLAALALPEFLKHHPECAADRQ
jgi:hypothetical protein